RGLQLGFVLEVGDGSGLEHPGFFEPANGARRCGQHHRFLVGQGVDGIGRFADNSRLTDARFTGDAGQKISGSKDVPNRVTLAGIAGDLLALDPPGVARVDRRKGSLPCFYHRKDLRSVDPRTCRTALPWPGSPAIFWLWILQALPESIGERVPCPASIIERILDQWIQGRAEPRYPGRDRRRSFGFGSSRRCPSRSEKGFLALLLSSKGS